MSKTQFIGSKKIKFIKSNEEKTPAGTEIIEVCYDDKDEQKEYFSKLMFDLIVDTKPCDESQLREKRIHPIVKMIAGMLREYGVKVGELPYLSSLLNQSLQFNSDQALLKLLGKWMPEPKSLDDIDYLIVDRILKGIDKR